MFLLLISLVLLILYISQINFRSIYLSWKIPGPLPFPFIGSGHIVFNKTTKEIFDIVVGLAHKHGEVFGVWITSDYHIMISDPKYVEIILSDSKFIPKSSNYKYLKAWLNDGLLLSKGAKWYQRRKLLTPAFHFKILEQLVNVFDRQSCVFIQTLSKLKQNEKVEMFPLVSLYTLDVICESAMGIQINTQQASNSAYVMAVKKLSELITIQMTSFLFRYDFLFRFSPLFREREKALKTVHDFTDNVIRERRNKILTDQNVGKDEIDETIGVKSKMNLLDILLKSTIDGKPLTDLDIREEVDTFMFEGHDTTSSAILFCLFNIAKYPEVQRKCFEEITDVLVNDETTPVTLNELNNLHYLDLVIKETLRLFPSVPLIGRTLEEETKLGKYTIPKGVEIGISAYLLGRNPRLFPNPDNFEPERFLQNTADQSNSFTFAYIPFSAGSRNCIGQKFAMLEMKSLISKVLTYYEISLAEDSQQAILKSEIILKTANKINFYIKQRKK